MFRSFLYRVTSWSAIQRIAELRRDLVFYWVTSAKDRIVLLALMAAPFVLFGGFVYFAYASNVRMQSEQQRHADLTCLAWNIYFEARGEPIAGQHAVAEVTLNRVVSRRFPRTVCDVVYEKRWDRKRKRYVGAFSWTELDLSGKPKGVAWRRALTAAETVYDSQLPPTVHGALFYHANTIKPRWAKTKKEVAKIGRHIFYE